MKFRFFLFCFIFSAVLIFADNAKVVLKNSTVYISRDKIYLGDIADFYNAGEDLLNEISTLYIKHASSPGYSVIITREIVENQLSKKYKTIDIEGPQTVKVVTEKATIEIDDIKKTVENYILENMPWKKEETEIIIKDIKENISTLNGNVLLKIKDEKIKNFKGNKIIPVEVTVDGKFYRIIPVSVLIKVTTDCMVAGQNIKIKEPVIDKVILQKTDITYLPNDVITDVETVRNKISRHAIAKGTVILNSMLDSMPIFKRGDNVTVAVKRGNITVETTGISMEDGKEGSIVKVKLVTGKIIEGRVLSDGKVIIQ
ncbi:MAG TPA: flagellar basal body P-ring formation chaperone FlgA [Candidatus Goldiibacteriota bacterium]|nr:flagellar basal body P-ring formation chaperone FlgA [Candidatus Goldiibacteriota bacterium]